MSKHNKLVRRVRAIIISANSNSSKFNTQQTTQFHHHMSVILDFQRALFHQSPVKFRFQYWNINATSFRGCGAVSPCLGPGSTCEEHDNTFTCYCAKVPYHQPDICHFWYATASSIHHQSRRPRAGQGSSARRWSQWQTLLLLASLDPALLW